jgi:endonuclease G
MFEFWRRALAALALCVFLAVVGRGEPTNLAEHLFLGNPSGAVADKDKPNNYLMLKRQYALSYNNSTGTPNWVSWQLSRKWLGRARRSDAFAPDRSLPAGFVVVRPNDYRAGGFDRGHLCPAADRSVSSEDSDATFLMTNMAPQAPDLNRGTWEKLEGYCRDQVRERDRDLYIVAGPSGRGGFGSDGYRTFLPDSRGRVVIPGKLWKVVLSVPAGTTDPKKLTAAEVQVFAVIMPNLQGLDHDWRTYAVSVRDVEELTGYTFFDKLPSDLAAQLQTRKPETRAKSAESAGGVKGKEKGRGSDLELPAFQPGCVIGNRESKIYHMSGGRGYEAAKKSKNAVYFKNAQDAEKAGYRAAKQ